MVYDSFNVLLSSDFLFVFYKKHKGFFFIMRNIYKIILSHAFLLKEVHTLWFLSLLNHANSSKG